MQTIANKTVAVRGVSAKRSVAARAAPRDFAAPLLAAAVLFNAGVASAEATKMNIIDDRKAISKGFDIIYEARDLDLDQRQRDGMTQVKEDTKLAAANIKESSKRIKTLIEPSIKKAYWLEARQELRRQVGTMRFDYNAIAATKSKAERNDILAKKKEFFNKVDVLDFALRSKNGDKAAAAYTGVVAALDAVNAAALK
jgi:photosystem II oxygen-evolving enhancer protein 3